RARPASFRFRPRRRARRGPLLLQRARLFRPRASRGCLGAERLASKLEALARSAGTQAFRRRPELRGWVVDEVEPFTVREHVEAAFESGRIVASERALRIERLVAHGADRLGLEATRGVEHAEASFRRAVNQVRRGGERIAELGLGFERGERVLGSSIAVASYQAIELRILAEAR